MEWAATPVVYVVLASAGSAGVVALGGRGFGEVRHFILTKTCSRSAIEEFVIHGASEIFIFLKCARLQLLIQRCILFVDDLVSGQMLATQRNRFVECFLPDFE